jgi:hypothetical protein
LSQIAHGQFTLNVTIAKNTSDRMWKPLSAMHHVTDVVLGPGEIAALGT